MMIPSARASVPVTNHIGLHDLVRWSRREPGGQLEDRDMSDRQGQAGAAGLGSEQPAKPGEAQGAEEGGQLQAEIRLRQEIEQRLSLFHQFVEASREGMGWADLDGNVRYMNPALGHMVGEKRPEDSYGKPVLRYYSEEAQRLLREEIFPTILREGMWTGEIALQSLTGQTVPTANSLFVLRDEQNRPASFANVVTDLTERKQAEEELRRHRNHLEELVTRRTADLARTNRELQHEIAERRIVEARLQRLDTAVAQSIDGVVMSDLEGVIEFANPAWARMHGFAVSDVLGRHISLFHSREQMDREVSPFIARILTDGAAEGEVGHVCRTGESFPAWQTGTYSKDDCWASRVTSASASWLSRSGRGCSRSWS
jgi:PAS domain S-box-containing protein